MASSRKSESCEEKPYFTFWPPWKGAKEGRGMKGATPAPPLEGSSMMTFSAPPSTRSIVSM